MSGGDGVFSMDIREFLAGADQATTSVIDGCRSGLREAGNQLLQDSIEEEPRAPHLQGALRASGKTEVGTENESMTEVLVGFDVPYAARWHEAENDIDPVTGGKIHWSEPGVGPKFIEAKMVKNGDKYVRITAEAAKGALGA